MKRSEIVAIEFDPVFKRIYVTRLWNTASGDVRTCRGYRHTHARVDRLWKLAGDWTWEQNYPVTTLRQ